MYAVARSLTRVLITNRRASSEASRSARAASVDRRKRPHRSISQERSSVPRGLKVSASWLGARSPESRTYGALADALTSGNWNDRSIVTRARASRTRAAATRTS